MGCAKTRGFDGSFFPFPLIHPVTPVRCPSDPMTLLAAVSPVPPMHEEMKDRAQEKERPRQDVQNMRLVFLPEEE